MPDVSFDNLVILPMVAVVVARRRRGTDPRSHRLASPPECPFQPEAARAADDPLKDSE
jgi:hypothetical protein